MLSVGTVEKPDEGVGCPAWWQPSAADFWFADLVLLTPHSHWLKWPNLAQLNALLGPELTLVAAQEQQQGYEAHIYRHGQVPTRSHNWHDLYNALIWALFPASKRAMNRAHMVAMHDTAGRGPRRDAITLFDECGLLLVAEEPAVFAELNAHHWPALLWQRRRQWLAGTIRPYLFGHALYEALRQPFAGLCGKVLGVVVDAHFGQLALAERYRLLDQQLAVAIDNNRVLTAPRQLAPLPLLGIPGAVITNAEPDYYLGEQFRPLRRPRLGFDCLDLRVST